MEFTIYKFKFVESRGGTASAWWIFKHFQEFRIKFCKIYKIL